MGIVPLIFLMQLNQCLCWDMAGAAQGAAARQGRASGQQGQLAWVYTACAFVVPEDNFRRTVSQLERASFHKTVLMFYRRTLSVVSPGVSTLYVDIKTVVERHSLVTQVRKKFPN